MSDVTFKKALTEVHDDEAGCSPANVLTSDKSRAWRSACPCPSDRHLFAIFSVSRHSAHTKNTIAVHTTPLLSLQKNKTFVQTLPFAA